MWIRRAEMMAANRLMLAVRHGHPALAALETQVAAIGEHNRAAAEQSLAFFDEQLRRTEFIGADRVTMADGVLFIGMEFARLIRFRIPPDLEHLTRWQSTMRARASASAGT
jgi:glutathione S-transferase